MTVADLVNPDDEHGRTYRQIHEATDHQIALGALVELESGVRLFVVNHSRDCDQTPLYCLSADASDRNQVDARFANRGWLTGYLEESLIEVKCQI